MARIVLAHGLLGFGTVLPLQAVEYFNGIRPLYGDAGHDVICPTVPALGSIAARAAALGAAIHAAWPQDGVPIFLLAHSLGGLDCRRLLRTDAGIARRVRRLVTVATPHFGSPVADAVLHPAFPALPSPFRWLGDFFADDAGALADLQTRLHVQDAAVPGVEYLPIGCDQAGVQPPSPVFALTADVGGFFPAPNDGVVGLASAAPSGDPAGLFQTWPVDHAGAVGWPSGALLAQAGRAALLPPADHVARYAALLPRLVS